MRAGLAREGVDVSELQVVAGGRSPQSSILVEEASASRAIVHYPGSLPPLELSQRAVELCREAAWLHVDHRGYAWAPDGARLSIDGGNPIPDLRLERVALYAPTEAQLRDRYGTPEHALDAGAELVVVTRGELGCAAYLRGGQVVEAPPVEVDAISTLGAGDVFHGALLARLVLGDPLAAALRAANVAAALSCLALDGRSAIPTADELEERSRAWHIASQ